MLDKDTDSPEVVTHIKNQELVKERRRQIVDAAVKLFIKHGYHKTTTRALAKAIRKALVLYGDPDLLDLFRVNAIQADFSWEKSAVQYLQLYQETLGAPMDRPA